MSWSVSVGSMAPDALFDALDDSFDANYATPAEGVKEQFEAGKEAIDGLLSVGVVRGKLFNCSLSGHAQQFDEDGKPLDATDSFSLNLTAVG